MLLTLNSFIVFSFFVNIELNMIENLSNVQGLIILTIQAHCKSFQPNPGRDPSPSQEAMLYAGLYAMAIGVGGVKASLPTHGADQLDHSNKRAISSFFNWYFFSLCTGGLLAVTLLVWVQENKGWQWGFTISAVTLFLGFCIFAGGLPFYRHKFPNGSPFIRIFKVIVGHPSMKLWGNWMVAKYLNWMTRIESTGHGSNIWNCIQIHGFQYMSCLI